MSLRRRSIVVVVAIALVLAIISYVPGVFVLRQNIKQLVNAQKSRYLERVQYILENDVESLRSCAQDWGAWDETYAFMHDQNSAFIQNNLQPSDLKNLGLTSIVFLAPDGRVAHSVHISDSQYVTDVDHTILMELTQIAMLKQEGSWGGLAMVNGSAAVLGAHEILNSKYEGPSRGTLLMVRVLSPADMERLSALAQANIEITPGVVSASAQHSPLDGRHIQVTGPLAAIGGTPLYASISFSPDAAVLGQKMAWHFALLLTAVTAAFMLVGSIMLKRYVVGPVANLTDYVQEMAAATGVGYEIGSGNEILAMEGLVRDVFAKLKDYQLLYTKMCEGVAVRQLILDEQGRPADYRYIDVNPSYEQMSGLSRAEVIGRTYREIRGTIAADWPEEYTEVALSGVPRRFIRRYGRGRWYEILCYQPKPLQFASVISDVTERVLAEEQARAFQKDLQSLVDTLADMLLVLDTTGKVVHVNRAVETTLGYTADELVGMSSYALHPEDRQEDVEDNIRALLMGREPLRSVPMRAKDGRFVAVETRSARGTWGGQDVIFAVVRDVSERMRSEERLLYLSMHDQLTDVYNRAFFAAEMDRLEGSREYPISIISADANGLKLINDVLGHRAGDEYLKAGATLIKGVLRKSDILARVGGDEFAIILPRTNLAAAEAIADRIRTKASAYKDDSSFLPMSFSLGAATSTGPSVSLDDAYKLADHLMYREKLAHKASTRDEILGALLSLLSERDYRETGHSQQVEDLCMLLGASLCLTHEQLADLKTLAQVHDLGNIAISAEILQKPLPLTEEEWELIRQHPEKGYRIAYACPDLLSVAELILRHHERWDGSGYPLGLSGTEIPIQCRILAIADAYSVMTGGRPYRSALTPEAALLELKRFAGVQFDPDLVERFCSLVRASGRAVETKNYSRRITDDLQEMQQK